MRVIQAYFAQLGSQPKMGFVWLVDQSRQRLIDKIGVQEELSISGGIAKNMGVVKRLERELGVTAHIASEPQIVGALGAAIFARERADA